MFFSSHLYKKIFSETINISIVNEHQAMVLRVILFTPLPSIKKHLCSVSPEIRFNGFWSVYFMKVYCNIVLLDKYIAEGKVI